MIVLLLLLLALSEFSGKVLEQDRQAVLKYFSREMKKSKIVDGDETVLYRQSLERISKGTGVED